MTSPPGRSDGRAGAASPPLQRRRITRARFRELVQPAVGRPVSSTWRGYGSAMFLEIGALREEAGRRHASGEMTIMIQWSWRVEGRRSIRFGSDSTERQATNGVRGLAGDRIAAVDVDGHLPELAVTLASGRVVRSFMTAEGQPDWCVFLPDGSWITVERGHLVHDTQNVPIAPVPATGA